MVVKNSELSYRVRILEEKNTELEKKRKDLVSDQYFNHNSTYFRLAADVISPVNEPSMYKLTIQKQISKCITVYCRRSSFRSHRES